MRLPTTVGVILLMPLLWFLGVVLTPAGEAGGLFSMSVADAILMHIRPWVYVTAGFYHPHLLQLLFVLPLTFALAKRVEPELGAMNTLRLLLFANVGASFIIFVQMFSLYIIFREPAYLNTGLSGFTGGITALLVAFMKPLPHATAPAIPGVKLRFYPLLAMIVFSGCSALALMTSMSAFRAALLGAGPYSVYGGFLSWYYLRFLNKNSLTKAVGDVSDDFAFVVLFPDFCTPIIGPFATFCFNVVQLCGFFKNRFKITNTTTPLPVLANLSEDPIAERRKARAMKALDEKLAKLAHAREDSASSSSGISRSALLSTTLDADDEE